MRKLFKPFPFFRQMDAMDCGPACLRMIAQHYGRRVSLQTLRQYSHFSKEGVNLLGLTNAAGKMGFQTLGAPLSFDRLQEAPLPCVVHWNQNHFVVLYRITSKYVYIADPGRGRARYTHANFIKHWVSIGNNGSSAGIALLLQPTSDFFDRPDEIASGIGLRRIIAYLRPYRRLIIQLFLGLIVGTLIQLIFPLLTQSIVDIGIRQENLHFITLILIGQLVLLAGKTSVEFVRSWILLHISARINVSILSDFLVKMMKLPLLYFDTKMTGDIMQRMNDHNRIENFLTSSSLSILFSVLNLVVFSILLAVYNLKIFFIFLIGSTLYLLWVKLFLNRRRVIDYEKFGIAAQNQSKIIQLVYGMHEIKLNDCEKQKRWEWEHLQANLFNINIKSLALGQYQHVGAFFINEGKNILITFVAAASVINGHMTLGVMLAIQYIIGQLNGPIDQLVQFIQFSQDARISMERLNEVHLIKDEEPQEANLLQELPPQPAIRLEQVSFRYPGAGNPLVLQEVQLDIPFGKVTAIVGMSGSGKTTLLKLLLKFYDLENGDIRLGDESLSGISHKVWRRQCGVVMQDGFIFSDTISRNIAVGDDEPDLAKLQHALAMANLEEFVNTLPLGLNTVIGSEGHGISQGQKQRILIARAIYKNPAFILFDEATNALDANNERVIMHHLNDFFKGRTVIIVAHRLSTVKDADNIVVLDKGRIIEQGTHLSLTQKKAAYYTLVKNQLELGA
ncbi:peptidase domain-containing ABC transporter [Chitinophaga vietnamensis]|uniref:peptidase domain-containing ABC transporter n=1 Tax=Chitinophaga vietnamensis TaxID=2593957 RepID=UPI001177C377|nr:peptidase domain-containing ABC transporter [Chitinophaga vietnamensis]